MTANSSTELGGVQTATLMPQASDTSLTARAGILIHESFHVFQRAHHPAWSPNEVELFTYPVDDAELLALRRLESDALRRALVAEEREQTDCWARAALALRAQRFASLPLGSIAYERGTELNEGLATYVERRATREPDATLLPHEEFAPEAVRQRGYDSGVALAHLLDRLLPTWRATLEQNDSSSLDALLSTALSTHDGPVCAFTTAERDGRRSTAAKDIRELHARRSEQRRAFLEQPGWRLVVVAADAPLFPQGFDPLNVQSVTPGEVIHSRFLALGNELGKIEILGRASLTEGVGDHPLFAGVRSLTVTGLASEPQTTETNGVVEIEAEGVTLELRGATVDRSDQTVTVRLSPQAAEGKER